MQRIPVLCRTCTKLFDSSKLLRCQSIPVLQLACYKSTRKRRDRELSSLLKPVPVTPHAMRDDINIGAEMAGHLEKSDLLKLLNTFFRRPPVKKLAAEHGLDSNLFHQAFVEFRKFCLESEGLPVDLHIIFADILQNAGHVDDVFPYFLNHARQIFPHLDCMEDLQKISDLRLPANWYPEARSKQRKIIYHAGPTNSGKTYHALQRFINSESGVYCGPLRLLANEVFNKCADEGRSCDLVTGEERRYSNEDGSASDHVSCTVEMMNVHNHYDVAVIDEIQMIRDPMRGWAWTRAVLGAAASEVHVCGEASAIDLIRDITIATGDELEIRRYKRLTKLIYLNESVGSFDNIRPGDCIVAFSKNDIYHISRELERRDVTTAVIYGGLPPGTKLAQAKRFNNPLDPCKVMVATDAIGMGLNLSIKRVVFYSMIKPHVTEDGEKEMIILSPSQVKQIAGRAGRFGCSYDDEGEVTTFHREDLGLLHDLSKRDIEPIERAGLHPTAEQIELFAYHLPKASLSNLLDIFVTLSRLDSDLYFMCSVEDFKFLADMIEHIPLPLRTRYVFCCSPIPKRQPFVCAMFLKFARQYARGEPLTLDWLSRQIGWPFSPPNTLLQLVHLEAVCDVLDLYLWLSYRFADMFPDVDHVRDMQQELDASIQHGVNRLVSLIQKSKKGSVNDDDDFLLQRQNAKRTGKRLVKNSSDELSEYQREVNTSARETLSDRLVSEGLLSKEQLTQLRSEIGAEVRRKGRRHSYNNRKP